MASSAKKIRQGEEEVNGNREEFKKKLKALSGWEIITQNGVSKLMRTYSFEDFSHLFAFTQQLDRIANRENHHPVLKSSWSKITVIWWTHSESELQDKDLEMAQECDALYAHFKEENRNEE